MSKMCQVLLLISSSRGGGAVHVRDLALGLDRSRFAVQVAMPEDGGSVDREDFEAAGIPFHLVDIAQGLSLRALAQVRRLSAQAGILHLHGARGALFGRLAAASLGSQRPRTVYTIHGFAAPHYPTPRRQALLWLERALARITDAWICVSNAEKDDLLSSGVADARRTQVIWNGIDPERFATVAKQRTETRLALGLPSGAFVITTVCRLHRPRDFPTLLDAFRLVQDSVPQAQLLIAGDGPLRGQIEQWVASLGLESHVRLLGMRRDVPRILGASDAFVLSSRAWEGLPLTVLEAMAASLPVVASDVGGTREAIVDGQTGYLFPPGDSAAVARHMRALASDPSLGQQMGQRGFARANELFTVRRMTGETAALYEKLLPQETSRTNSACARKR